MDPVAIAATLIQGQNLVNSGNVGVSLLKKEHDMQTSLIDAVMQQAQALAPQPPEGTGQYLNLIA